ncbi:MAG: SDR family oxidoreductase [Halioglobus sp.]|nr:SDR family oxidoreductase [Halioglobus sp.]
MRRILITGANKGIGLACVRAALQQAGDIDVLLGSRDSERGAAARQALLEENPAWASRLQVLPIDVTSADSVDAARTALLAACADDPAPLYGLVNNAGVGLASDDLAAVLAVNTLGVKRVCDAFLPLLRDGGRVVNVSSASGPKFVSQCSAARQAFFTDGNARWTDIEELIAQLSAPGDAAQACARLGLGEFNPYGLSKACVSLYTLILARQHPRLRINACTPGYIETDLTRPQALRRGVSPQEMGMQPPQRGTVSILHLLLGDDPGSGYYFGSDALRSPLDRYRAPGSPAYTGP